MWKILTSADLLNRLSDREKTSLETAAINIAQQDVLAEIVTLVADDWRSRIGMYHVVDIRPDSIPSELLMHILADFRYRAFTRLPSMQSLLDDLRVKEWDRAMRVMDTLQDYVIANPDPANMPPETSGGAPIITVPWRPC